MKPLFRLPTAAAALASIFLLGAGLTRAADGDDPGRRAAAEGLLGAMHTEQMLEQNLGRMLTLVDRFSQSAAQTPGVTPDQLAVIKKAEDEARDTIHKELGYATLKDEFVKAYAETFTEPELKEITTFYSSPVGQKFVEKQTAVTDKVAQISQQKVRTVMPGVVQKLREVAQKNLPPPPTPATVVPAPGAPPAAPVPPPPAPGAPPAPAPNGNGAVPPLPPTPAGVPPVAPTPPVSAVTSPVPVMPTPVPTPSAATTPSVQ